VRWDAYGRRCAGTPMEGTPMEARRVKERVAAGGVRRALGLDGAGDHLTQIPRRASRLHRRCRRRRSQERAKSLVSWSRFPLHLSPVRSSAEGQGPTRRHWLSHSMTSSASAKTNIELENRKFTPQRRRPHSRARPIAQSGDRVSSPWHRQTGRPWPISRFRRQ